MTDFHTTRAVVAKKAHRCDQCFRAIDPGVTYAREVGSYCNDFYSRPVHVECADAAADYHRTFLYCGDDWPCIIHDLDRREDGAWMKDNYPIVAVRLGWCEPEECDCQASVVASGAALVSEDCPVA